MIIDLKNEYEWQKWFAWRPILLEGNSKKHFVWFSTIYRRKYGSMFIGYFYEYSLTNPNQ